MRYNTQIVCYFRRMGLTSMGNVGVFPAGTQLGDRIALFHDGGALYVIRDAPDKPVKYNFIGECYIDGMMDGALMEEDLRRGNTSTTIVLV